MQLGYAMESEDRNTVFWIERRGGPFRRETHSTALRETRRKIKENIRDGRMFFCRLRRLMLDPFCENACGRSWNARCWLLRRSRSAEGSTTSGSGLEWSMRAKLCCLHISITKLRRCCMCRRIFPMRARRSLWHGGGERIRKLLEITRGRAFVLFTSYAQMNEIYQRLLGEDANSPCCGRETRQRARCSRSFG